jgi:hypothetical protein
MTSVARHDKWEGGDARISEHGAHGGLRETAVGGTSASWSGIRPGRDEGSCASRASRESAERNRELRAEGQGAKARESRARRAENFARGHGKAGAAGLNELRQGAAAGCEERGWARCRKRGPRRTPNRTMDAAGKLHGIHGRERAPRAEDWARREQRVAAPEEQRWSADELEQALGKGPSREKTWQPARIRGEQKAKRRPWEQARLPGAIAPDAWAGWETTRARGELEQRAGRSGAAAGRASVEHPGELQRPSRGRTSSRHGRGKSDQRRSQRRGMNLAERYGA